MDFIGGSISSSHRKKRKMYSKNNLHGEFRKAKATKFDGEIKYGQEADAWLLGMRKYFQVQDYSRNAKEARVAIFNLNRRSYIWWDCLRQVKNIN